MPDKAQVWEPFCGGLHVSIELAKRPGLRDLVCSDVRECLISLYRYAQAGGALPDTVSEDDHKAARALPDSDPRKAFILIGCSWGGTYSGGYARSATGQDYCGNAKRALALLSTRLSAARAVFEHMNFFDVAPGIGDVLIYCDPPYASTRGYTGLPFDHDAFWRLAQEHAEAGSAVFVSEYSAPLGWQVVWEEPAARKRTAGIRRKTERPRERLYTWAG